MSEPSWHLEAIDPRNGEMFDLGAPTEAKAREKAAERTLHKPSHIWLEPTLTTCERIG